MGSDSINSNKPHLIESDPINSFNRDPINSRRPLAPGEAIGAGDDRAAVADPGELAGVVAHSPRRDSHRRRQHRPVDAIAADEQRAVIAHRDEAVVAACPGR